MTQNTAENVSVVIKLVEKNKTDYNTICSEALPHTDIIGVMLSSCVSLLALIIVILRYVDGKHLQNVQRKCPVVKKETFLCSHFQTLGGRYAIKCCWQSHLRCQQSGYTLLFLSLSLFSYIKRERLHNRMSKAVEVVYFAYGGVLYCTL